MICLNFSWAQGELICSPRSSRIKYGVFLTCSNSSLYEVSLVGWNSLSDCNSRRTNQKEFKHIFCVRSRTYGPLNHVALYQIIVHRHNSRLPTIITSMLDFKDELDPITSRVQDGYISQVIPIKAPDYRNKKKSSSRKYQKR